MSSPWPKSISPWTTMEKFTHPPEKSSTSHPRLGVLFVTLRHNLLGHPMNLKHVTHSKQVAPPLGHLGAWIRDSESSCLGCGVFSRSSWHIQSIPSLGKLQIITSHSCNLSPFDKFQLFRSPGAASLPVVLTMVLDSSHIFKTFSFSFTLLMPTRAQHRPKAFHSPSRKSPRMIRQPSKMGRKHCITIEQLGGMVFEVAEK